MPDGGTATEQKRKASFDAKQNQARRQPSKTQKTQNWLQGVQKKYEKKARMNAAISQGLADDLSEKTGGAYGRHRTITGKFISPYILIPQPKSPDQEAEENEDDEEYEEEEGQNPEADNAAQQQTASEQTQQAQLQANQQQQRIRQQTASQLKEAALAKAREKTQKMVKKRFNNLARRGSEELAQFIGNAFDLGSGGTSTIVTIFVYAFTLTDLNLQMIWGHYVKKGKSFLFPAFDDWDPLPISTRLIPIVVGHVALVLVDFFVLMCVAIMLTVMIIITFGPILAAIGFWSAVWLYITDDGFRTAINDYIL